MIFSTPQAYHSSLMDADTKMIGNMAMLPLKTQFKGPGPKESMFSVQRVNSSINIYLYFIFRVPTTVTASQSNEFVDL